MKLEDISKKVKEFVEDNKLNLLIQHPFVNGDSIRLTKTLEIEKLVTWTKEYCFEDSGMTMLFNNYRLTMLLGEKRYTFNTADREVFADDKEAYKCWSPEDHDYALLDDHQSPPVAPKLQYYEDAPQETYKELDYNHYFNDELKGFFEILSAMDIHSYLKELHSISMHNALEKRKEHYQKYLGESADVSYNHGKNAMPSITISIDDVRETFRFEKKFTYFVITTGMDIKKTCSPNDDNSSDENFPF